MSEASMDAGKPKHLPSLDGIRGLAIVMVLLTHFGNSLADEPAVEESIKQILHRGWYGVDLFFVLSGFLITGILIDSLNSRSYFSTFYIRRILRIFPLYYFFLFFLYAIRRPLVGWIWGYDPMPGVDLRWHLAYLSNWRADRGLNPDEATHMWSLAIEEQFYLVWPMIVYLVPRRLLGYVCLAGIACALGLREVLVLRHSWWEMLHRFTPVRMDTLLMGALMAIAYRDETWRARCSRFLLPVGFFFGAWFFAGQVGLTARFHNRVISSIAETLDWSTAPAAFACLVFWAATGGRESRFLTSRLMTTFGRYSYGIYVWHVFAWRLFPSTMIEGRPLPVKLLYILLLVVVSCVFAWFSWNLLEQPFLKLKSRFPYSPARRKRDAVEPVAAIGEAV